MPNATQLATLYYTTSCPRLHPLRANLPADEIAISKDVGAGRTDLLRPNYCRSWPPTLHLRAGL